MRFLAVVYLPPGSEAVQFRRFLTTVEDTASSYPNHKLLVGGDFNLHHVRWSNNPLEHNFSTYAPPGVRDSASVVNDILASSMLFNFIQHTPLRVTHWIYYLRSGTAWWTSSVPIHLLPLTVITRLSF